MDNFFVQRTHARVVGGNCLDGQRNTSCLPAKYRIVSVFAQDLVNTFTMTPKVVFLYLAFGRTILHLGGHMCIRSTGGLSSDEFYKFCSATMPAGSLEYQEMLLNEFQPKKIFFSICIHPHPSWIHYDNITNASFWL